MLWASAHCTSFESGIWFGNGKLGRSHWGGRGSGGEWGRRSSESERTVGPLPIRPEGILGVKYRGMMGLRGRARVGTQRVLYRGSREPKSGAAAIQSAA